MKIRTIYDKSGGGWLELIPEPPIMKYGVFEEKGEAMLKTQQFLREHSLEKLVKDYAIQVAHSPIGEPLVILNYCQIDSPKYSPITRECRGLVLETGTWDVVAKGFNRFFNYGECRAEINEFNWNDFSVQTKEDGSLAILYWYKDSWRINTRGSFAQGKICDFSDFTWETLFFNTINEKGLDWLCKDCTYVFELCSIYNKVVRTYQNPTSFLLAVFNNVTGEEVDFMSTQGELPTPLLIGTPTPLLHKFSSIDEILAFLESSDVEATFEGFVIKDNVGNRIKIKNKNYLRLHRMRGNGDNLFAPKNLVPFILSGETDELLAIYPEVEPYVNKFTKILNKHLATIEAVWEQIKNRNTQKSFALKVMELCPKWSSILFKCRKEQKSPLTVWRESVDLIIKTLETEFKEQK